MPVSTRHPLHIPTPLLALCEIFARAPLGEKQGCRPLCRQCPCRIGLIKGLAGPTSELSWLCRSAANNAFGR
eukprot:8793791-Lingulodinium_polyedra.AAC.1